MAAVRFPGLPLYFEETTVSGPGASLPIVDALQAVVTQPGVDVVILARGGGDGPSMLPWSSEEVCRAVAACPVPVVSAIGHEADRPLCDEVADVRCGTPSIAAAAVIPDRAGLVAVLDGHLTRAGSSLLSGLETSRRRLTGVEPRRALGQGVEQAAHRLDRMTDRLAGAQPGRRLPECRARLAAPDWRRPLFELLGRAGGRLDADLRHLQALSPARTLDRGYAVVTGPDGAVVRDAGVLRIGDAIAVRLAAGRVRAAVTDVGRDADGDG